MIILAYISGILMGMLVYHVVAGYYFISWYRKRIEEI